MAIPRVKIMFGQLFPNAPASFGFVWENKLYWGYDTLATAISALQLLYKAMAYA